MSTDRLFHLATGSLQVAAGISPIGGLVVYYQQPTALQINTLADPLYQRGKFSFRYGSGWNQKVEPSSARLPILICLPMPNTNCWLMARPVPVLPLWWVLLSSTWLKTSNSRGCSSSVILGPQSMISKRRYSSPAVLSAAVCCHFPRT